MKKNFPYIILLSALLISVVAEYFSIFGISKLFSGAHIATIVLAVALGAAKLVAVSSIQQYWKQLGQSVYGRILRIYLSIATFVLIVVTSAGVYGFLAAAYQQTANADRFVQTKIDLLKVKKDRFESQRAELSGESKSLSVSLEQLRKSLSTDNQFQTIDRRTGQVITQIQSTSKKGVQDQIEKTSSKKDDVDLKLSRLGDSISVYDLLIIETEVNSKSTSELGPLKYLSGLTGYPMDKIINWLMLLLVCVIDPLAIALVLTSQFAFRNDRWIRGVETRKRNQRKNEKSGNRTNRLFGGILEKIDSVVSNIAKPAKSPTINDLSLNTGSIDETVDRSTEVNTERIGGIVEEIKPKKRGRKPKVNKKIIDHFNVDIDPIADPDGILQQSSRMVVENLTPETAEHLIKSLDKKKV